MTPASFKGNTGKLLTHAHVCIEMYEPRKVSGRKGNETYDVNLRKGQKDGVSLFAGPGEARRKLGRSWKKMRGAVGTTDILYSQ